MKNEIVTKFDPAQILAAMQKSLNSMIRLQASDLVRVINTEQTVRSVSSVPFPLANFVVYVNISEAGRTDEMLKDYPHEQSLWFLMSTSTRQVVGQRLIDNGFTLIEERPVFAAKIASVMPKNISPFDVISVENQQQIEDWISVQSNASGGFSDDVLHTYRAMMQNLVYDKQTFAYVAYDQNQPVGCAILALAGGVAGFYQLAVLPEARRRGVGTALAAHRMRVAADNGYQIVGMMVTSMGQMIHSKLGFQDISKVHMYMKV